MHTTAYVCCTEEDRWIAEQIADALKEHGLSAWTYWSAIDAEGDLGQQVQEGIEQSEAFIIIISPSSVKSKSIGTELGVATALGKTVIPVATHEPPVDEVWRLVLGHLPWVELSGRQVSGRAGHMLADRVRRSASFGTEAARDSAAACREVSGATAVEVFISAKSEDYEHAERVYRFLSDRSVAPFFGERSLREIGSADYRKEIDRALEQAKHLVVVGSSQENVMANWVEAEWGAFINEKRSGRKEGNIVTVAVPPLQPEDLPMSLRYYEVVPLDEAGLAKLLAYVRS